MRTFIAIVRIFSASTILWCGIFSFQIFADTVRNRASIYSDNQGVSRDRYKLDLDLSKIHEQTIVTQTTYKVSASEERYTKDDISEDEYMQTVYGGGRKTTDAFTLGLGQTWNKLTDTRSLVSYSTDGKMTGKTGAVGVGHWFWHENLQLNFDISRTLVDQPVFDTLGADSDVISPPAVVTSTGSSLGVKYLANPKTTTGLTFTHVEKNDRPPANIYSFALKQFIPTLFAAIHADISRGFNQGRVTSRSSYGEVNAWIAEAAWLQRLWQGSNSKVAYRYYREDETTRVEGDEYTRGSDTVSLFLSQDINARIGDSTSTPLVLEGSVSQYKTNEIEPGVKIAAVIYEFGVLAKF